MGSIFTKSEPDRIISNVYNDYNPFNIPIIELNSPDEFNGAIALKGCPPLDKYTKAQFANFPIEIQAAYADGVVRGSYQKEWLQEQHKSFDPQFDVNNSAIGALAYMYLKTRDSNMLDDLTKWNNINSNNHNFFNN